jgi:Skp family chaperone for outer membrane proteins
MKRIQNFGLIFLVAALFVSACDQGPAGAGGGGIAIMDLSAIAKATGQDEAIRQDAETARAELSAQLQQLATNLEQQLAAEREKVGISPSEADQQRLQEMTMQARQQISNAQMQAQSQASLMEQELVTAFRDKLTPLAEEIAKAKGASAVLAADSYLFWFDPTIDITDEVIAAWRALPGEKPVADEEAATDVADELAEVQAEFEQLESEQAGIEKEVDDLQEKLQEELEDTADQAEEAAPEQ